MKRFLSLLAFGLCIVTSIAAQGNGNGNGNSANGGGNGNGSNAQQAPVAINWQVAHRVLQEAAPYFQQQLNLNFGQLIQRYFQGLCSVSLVATNPPTNNVYRVAIGGTGIVVIIDFP
jgi:hypothetical protein